MTELKGYHAHVYYDPTTRPVAERLRDTIIGQFAVKPGAFSDEPIGPHPISQFSVIFETQEFQNVVPWLMLNREGLDGSDPSTDRELVRRPQQECALARHAGADAARNSATDLSYRAAAGCFGPLGLGQNKSRVTPTVLRPALGAGKQSAAGYRPGNTGRRRQREWQTSDRTDCQIGEGLRLKRIAVPANLFYPAHRGAEPPS